MIECHVFDDPRVLGRWAGQNLLLDGVKLSLSRLVDDDDDNDTKRRGREEDSEEEGERKAVANKGETDRSCISWLLWTMAEIETLWLAGRPNSSTERPGNSCHEMAQ